VNWKGRKVLVTGAGGFIGSHLVEALVKRGARTTTLVHYNSRNDWGWIEALPETVKKKLSVFPGDVRDPENVRKAVRGQEVVFHLAALIAIPFSYEAPESYLSTNLGGTMNVLQACLEAKVQKLVHTSTSEVYGTAQYTPIDEKHPLQAQSPYAASKLAADMLALSYHHAYGLPVVIVRPFNTYGPYQKSNQEGGVVAVFLARALAGKSLPVFGEGSQTRDFLYVDDCADLVLRAAADPRALGEIVNGGTGREITILELAKLIAGPAGRIEHKPHPHPQSEIHRLRCDPSKAMALLGWKPTVTLEEGIRRTKEWMSP